LATGEETPGTQKARKVRFENEVVYHFVKVQMSKQLNMASTVFMFRMSTATTTNIMASYLDKEY
jgi:hypothetical protein